MNPPPSYRRFFAELKRRRVFRVMAVYGAVAFEVVQVADIAFPRRTLPWPGPEASGSEAAPAS